MFPFVERLDEEQRIAVTSDADRLCIVAGAGTGKTTTLTSRVAWLVANGVRPERVMLVTFTRRAASEMVARTDALLGEIGAGGHAHPGRVRAGTFHSIAHRTLRRHARSLGLDEGFSVLDPADAGDLLDLVRQDHLGARTTERRFPRKSTLLDLYSRAVNTQRPLSEVVADVAPWASDRVDDIAAICRGYVDRKRALAVLDFDDLLLHWRAAVRHPQMGPALAGELDAVLVDEYQDVNTLQVDVLVAMCTADDGPSLTVVGDDSQAVYSFRGSSPRHLLDIGDSIAGVHTVSLQRNHRSTQAVLDVANAVAADAPEGFGTRLRSAIDEESGIGGPRPELITCHDEDAEAAAVCERILGHREDGTALSRQAVLVRAAHHSALLEIELGRRRIPFVKYGGLRFLEAAHVKDLICVFRLADNPRDELAWFRVLQLLDGVGPATSRRVIDELGLADGDAEVRSRWPAAAVLLPAAAREVATGLVDAMARVPGESAGTQADRLVGALEPMIRQAYPDFTARLADLDALCNAAEGCSRVSDVAADLSLEPPSSTGDLADVPTIDEDWMVISTIHSAKGLEWDVVHLLRVADGDLPSDMALTDREGLEEERRLFYVAVTRPARALHMYQPLRFHHRPRGRDDAHTYGQPSRFLSERVRSVLDHTRPAIDGRCDEPVMVSQHSVDLELDALWA